MNRTETYEDDGTRVIQFLTEYDVVCPQCAERAHVRVTEQTEMLLFAPRRMTCGSCGHSEEWKANKISPRFDDEPTDWYFQAEFWHKRPCCGHVLWVANREHLEFLKSYIGAKIRSHVRTVKGWSNRSLSARLPRWISSARNREAILTVLCEIETEMKASDKAQSQRQPHRSKRVARVR